MVKFGNSLEVIIISEGFLHAVVHFSLGDSHTDRKSVVILGFCILFLALLVMRNM